MGGSLNDAVTSGAPAVIAPAMHGMLCLVAALAVFVCLDDSLYRRRTRLDRVRAGALVMVVGLVALNALAVAGALGPVALVVTDFLTSVVAIGALLTLLVLRRRRPHEAPAPSTGPVLVIGAHPDDIELGCGGTVARLTDHGRDVHVVVMSAGSNGGDAARRQQEAGRGAARLAASSVEVLDFPDTRLESRAADMVRDLDRVIREKQPTLILTHSRHDQHQDHHAVHLATVRAARGHHSILCYESPSVTREFDPSVFVDIGAYVDTKVAAIRAHRDQRSKPYMSDHRVRGIAAFRGQQARLGLAEAFEPVRLQHAGIGWRE